ncbi:hypothetical protein MOA67_gp160 [Klebsiella phage KpLz-2_45]|uniref:hypothetical protein n=1 Tax=Klebsiella phage KpLz-2_45 TaxID=2698923 RepID=UPI001F14213B|nr:hypothetical protein MOA67_gp160 [Klebsiella phage KpLz-2_45]UKS72026.1 hypothetical protein KpLz245_1600 [Klebsiella phage KpLz-2_45]
MVYKRDNPRKEKMPHEFLVMANDYRTGNCDLSVTMEITNNYRYDLAVQKSDGTDNVVFSHGTAKLRGYLIIHLTVLYCTDTVNIDDPKNNYAEASFGLYDAVKGNCMVHFDEDLRCSRNHYKYRMVFLIDESDFDTLGSEISVPGLGMRISKASLVDREETIHDIVQDDIGCKISKVSGIVVSAVDKERFVEGLYYTIGNQVLKVNISRASNEPDGVTVQNYGKIKEGLRLLATKSFFSFEDAISGNNPLGIKFHTSREAALKELEMEKASLKEGKQSEDKEKKAKVVSAWIKAGGEFIKSILPTMMKAGKWLLSFLTKKAVLGATAAAVVL